MNGRRVLLLAAVAVAVVQIGFLVSMIAGRAAILRSGQEVVLEVLPVDPRDLLRGDYVTLDYNISRIPAAIFPEPPSAADLSSGRTVFVRLRAGEDGVWKPVAARFDRKPEPEPGDGEVDIRGSSRPVSYREAVTLDIRYGIERFYVPEGEGKAIESDLRQRSFRMKVAVARDGSAQIKSFHDGDAMLYAEPLY